jgi:hypothetical protein
MIHQMTQVKNIRRKVMFTFDRALTCTRIAMLTATVLGGTAPAAWACAPAPSCWIKEGPAYLRSVCLSYAKDHQTLKQIAMYLEEPEKIAAFGKACEKLHVHLAD